MNRFFVILLLCPLTVVGAEWRYDGQGFSDTGTHSGGFEAPTTGMSTTPARNLRDVPVNPMTMPVVRETFGEPDRTLEGVGRPPIARWQYPEYVVYFENDQVITTVAGRL